MVDGSLVGGQGGGRRSDWLLFLRGAEPARGQGVRLIFERPISGGNSLILGAPLLDLLHQSLNVYVLQNRWTGLVDCSPKVEVYEKRN